MKIKEISQIILDFIHSETNWGVPLRPNCEFEELKLNKIEKTLDGSYEVIFRYEFDEDGFSQYDKTHTFEGRLEIKQDGSIIINKFKEVHTGVAAHRYYGDYHDEIKQKEKELMKLQKKLAQLKSKLDEKELKLEDKSFLNEKIDLLQKKINELKKNDK